MRFIFSLSVPNAPKGLGTVVRNELGRVLRYSL
jgi:hypothetical protein